MIDELFKIFPWSNWIAKSRCGAVQLFEERPHIGERGFWESDEGRQYSFGCDYMEKSPELDERNWTFTLRHRPEYESLFYYVWCFCPNAEQFPEGSFAFVVKGHRYYCLKQKDSYALFNEYLHHNPFFEGDFEQTKEVIRGLMSVL